MNKKKNWLDELEEKVQKKFDEKILENKPVKTVSDRVTRRESKQYAGIQASLTNTFFRYCEKIKDKELQEIELKRLEIQWKDFVSKWNRNPKRHVVLKNGDFLKFIDNYLKSIDQQTKIDFHEKETKKES